MRLYDPGFANTSAIQTRDLPIPTSDAVVVVVEKEKNKGVRSHLYYRYTLVEHKKRTKNVDILPKMPVFTL